MRRVAILSLVLLFLISACTRSPYQEIETILSTESQDSWMTRYIDPPTKVKSEQVFTFLCESIVRRPTTLTDTCADFGEAVFDITWKTWGIEGAKGRGTLSINACEPDCADGTRKEYPVTLILDRITFDGARYLLNYLTIIPDVIDNVDLYTIWDLGSFYREAPDMRR